MQALTDAASEEVQPDAASGPALSCEGLKDFACSLGLLRRHPNSPTRSALVSERKRERLTNRDNFSLLGNMPQTAALRGDARKPRLLQLRVPRRSTESSSPPSNVDLQSTPAETAASGVRPRPQREAEGASSSPSRRKQRRDSPLASFVSSHQKPPVAGELVEETLEVEFEFVDEKVLKVGGVVYVQPDGV